MTTQTVLQLRHVLVADDFDATLTFFRDRLGMTELSAFSQGGGHIAILDAGRATLEIVDRTSAAHIDRVEAGGPVHGQRIALQVPDSEAAARELVAAGGTPIAEPVTTPWRHRNVRVRAPGGVQLTLFTVLDGAEE